MVPLAEREDAGHGHPPAQSTLAVRGWHPGSHTQSLSAALPAGELLAQNGQEMHTSLEAFMVPEYLPRGQAVQSDGPVTFLYLPATHPEHGRPSGPVKPAVHVQFQFEMLPTGADEPLGQSKQSPALVAASIAEYLPAEHSEQLPGPATSLYVPLAHLVQGP